MARIRSAKPEWWSKVKWCRLPRDVRFTYKGIWEVMADDEGRFQADTRLIKGDVWPLDDDITTKKLEKWLAQLEAVTVTEKDHGPMPAVLLYEVGGVRYGFLPGFVKHQKISHPTPSKLPAPPESRRNGSGKAPESLRPDVDLDVDLERSGIRSGADARASAPEKAAEPASSLSLLVDRFLETFYGSATPERREAVKQQLRDTLGKEGARIRRGEVVKARDSAHLASCLKDTIRSGVKDPDKAIVVVLKKLCDPELDSQGRTNTEATSQRTKSTERRERQYHDAKVAAAAAWSKENPDKLAELEQGAIMAIPGDTQVGAIARAERVLQEIGKRINFPSFEDWSP